MNSRLGFVNDAKAKTEIDDRPAWHLPEQAAAFILATGFFTTIGPFGTFEMSFLWRVSYWVLALGIGWFFVTVSLMGLRRFGIVHADAHVAEIGGAIILAALPTAVGVLALESLMRPSEGPFWDLGIMLNVAVVCLVLGGLMFGLVRSRMTNPKAPELAETSEAAEPLEVIETSEAAEPLEVIEPPAPITPPAHAAFIKRLPPPLGAELISLTSQDHYVEVTTEKGRELIHMRLADALHELREYPGQQIHRSHWIAARAFQGLSRENGKLVAHLSDGRRLNVSRSFNTAAREMVPVTVKNPE